MNKLDLFLLIPVALGFVFGLYKGFVKEITSLASIFFGIYGAKLLSPLVSNILIAKFDFSTKTAQPLAYLLIFIAILVIMLMLAKMLDKVFDSMSLGGVNKLFGGIFGALKIALIVSVLLNIFDAIDSKFSILTLATKDNSIGYKPLMKLAPKLWEETKKDTKSQSENSNEKK
jgi:membrane protein required for colicin V production